MGALQNHFVIGAGFQGRSKVDLASCRREKLNALMMTGTLMERPSNLNVKLVIDRIVYCPIPLTGTLKIPC